jgi:hypothetical protein
MEPSGTLLQTASFMSEADDASALTDPYVEPNRDTVTSAVSRGDLERGFEIFQNDMAFYVDSFGDIEKQTGTAFTTMHEMIIDNPCMRGYEEEEEGPSKIEVEFNGARDLIMYSTIGCSSIDEVAVMKSRKRSFLRGLPSRRSSRSNKN